MKRIIIHRNSRIDGLAKFKFIRMFYGNFAPFAIIVRSNLNKDMMVFDELENTGHLPLGAMMTECSAQGHSYQLEGEDLIITSKNAHRSK